jgi:hypothetical protein
MDAKEYPVLEHISSLAFINCRALYAEQKMEMVEFVRAWYDERERRILCLKHWAMDVINYIYPLLKEIGEDAEFTKHIFH